MAGVGIRIREYRYTWAPDERQNVHEVSQALRVLVAACLISERIQSGLERYTYGD